jgi:hypothetical protein
LPHFIVGDFQGRHCRRQMNLLLLYFWFIEIRELIIIKKRCSCYGGAIHTATSYFDKSISFCLSTLIIEAKHVIVPYCYPQSY